MGTVSFAVLASGALAGCGGGSGSSAAPVPAAPPAGSAFAAPDAIAEGAPTEGLEVDDDGNPLATAKCTAPPPDPHTASITLTGKAGWVIVPCFKDFTSAASVPASTSTGVVVKLAASTDKNLGAVINKKLGTPIVYASLTPNKNVTFASTKAVLSTYVISPSEIAAPHTYAVEVYVPELKEALQTITDIKPVPKSHEIKFTVSTLNGNFPAIEAVVIVYRST
jgi:hypothetical protein